MPSRSALDALASSIRPHLSSLAMRPNSSLKRTDQSLRD
jgi:hypothetical protein